jgi:predicted nucleic acid-binding protein
MIVVDSNVLVYLYLPSEHTAGAEALREREPEWAALSVR